MNENCFETNQEGLRMAADQMLSHGNILKSDVIQKGKHDDGDGDNDYNNEGYDKYYDVKNGDDEDDKEGDGYHHDGFSGDGGDIGYKY